jgi:hypothetical protein
VRAGLVRAEPQSSGRAHRRHRPRWAPARCSAGPCHVFDDIVCAPESVARQLTDLHPRRHRAARNVMDNHLEPPGPDRRSLMEGYPSVGFVTAAVRIEIRPPGRVRRQGGLRGVVLGWVRHARVSSRHLHLPGREAPEIGTPGPCPPSSSRTLPHARRYVSQPLPSTGAVSAARRRTPLGGSEPGLRRSKAAHAPLADRPTCGPGRRCRRHRSPAESRPPG